MDNSQQQAALAYHHRTKHHFDRYAQSLGYLDWATQPDPFRRYEGAPVTRLTYDWDRNGPKYADLFVTGAIKPHVLDARSLALLMEYSLAISAWKQYRGSRWALRVNPSSGNLHPTEGYVILPSINEAIVAGVYHYLPAQHALEQRIAVPPSAFLQLAEGFGPGTIFVALTSIYWREAWKYGERAWRYCQHDTGHAMASIALSCAALGWSSQVLSEADDDSVAQLLGLDRSDAHPNELEQPEAILAIDTGGITRGDMPRRLPTLAVEQIAAGAWRGKANVLSSAHVDWSVIGEVHEACRKVAQFQTPCPTTEPVPIVEIANPRNHSAWQIIFQRRSGLDFDATAKAASSAAFYQIISRAMPIGSAAPWTALTPPACVHLVVFVHNVDGLDRGVYVLMRSEAAKGELQMAMQSTFSWETPPGCPAGLPFYLLLRGDARRLAAQLSCQQDIAGDGAFSLGMLAEVSSSLRRFGAWWYRRLYWECGMIGQLLYLEAEAQGLRGTGIGCYFDDAVHELLGLHGDHFQSLYHFAVGVPVEDARLTTLPPY